MSLAGYELIQPYTVTSTGTMWMARTTDGSTCLIRFLSTDEFQSLRARIEVLSTISSPHVARIRDVVPDDGRVGIVTDMVEGTVLSQWMHVPGALVQNRVRAVLRDIALGLKALHDHKIAHGDLSVSNVIIHEDAAVLIDHVMGTGVTRPYAAPELEAELDGTGPVQSDRRPADVWAWAKIAQELGFECPVVARALHPDPTMRASIDEVLVDPVIASGASTSKIPMEANVSMLSAGDLLRIEAAREQTIISPTDGRRPRGRHARKRNRGWVRTAVASVMVLAGAVALTGWWLRPAPDTPIVSGGGADVETSQVQCPTSGEAISIVNDLTARRNAAIMQADPELLPAVLQEDSDVLDKDVELIESMIDAGVSVSSLATEIDDVRVMECAPLTIDATFTQAPHERCQGGECQEIPAQPSVRVRLEFEGPPWRVVSVSSLEPDAL
ncbi:MAG TPA: protein kinase family protein [Actinomyces sp.]|jgi:hypothetical protein|nr:protein kinase family protein [Acidobacteriota bacterium]HHT40104.1 protein kinase family protein [Actinomyces sp.]